MASRAVGVKVCRCGVVKGKELGTNNQSEKEMSFPIGTVLHVTQILVRVKDKSAEADVYGASAEIVLKAHV